MQTVYLDNNATTRPLTEAIAAMTSAMEQDYANPSSMHRPGQHARKLVDDARAQVAALVGCDSGELLFTSGGTESINSAISGLLKLRAPRRRIIVSAVEHSATQGACEQASVAGATIVEIGVDQAGRLDMDQLRHELASDDAALVSIMWANNETGVLFDAPAIADECRKAKVPFHCDATQAVGKIPVNVREAKLDMMSFASHKIHGPKGVGGLFIRRGQRFAPLISGGPQERNRRGGTENVPGIVGFGVAAELAASHLPEMKQVAELRDYFERQVLTTIADSHVNGAVDSRLSNTTNIGFARLESEAILMLLSEKGICASAGAACSSGSLEASHVLKAMKIDPKIAHGAIRFSLSRFTTRPEIDYALGLLPEVISRLRQVLPVG